jgi:hypothetical protein
MVMTLDINNLQQKRRRRKEQITSLNRARHFLTQASRGLSTGRSECDCCGFALWDDEPEARMHRSIDSALNQTYKVKSMVIEDLEDIEELLDM